MENQSSYSPLAKVIATVVIITFTMLLLKPTAIAAQVLYEEHKQANAKAAQAEAVKLSQTLQTVETTLTALRNTLSTESPEAMLSKPQDNVSANRSATVDLAQVQKNLKGLKQQVLKLDKYVQTDFAATQAHIRHRKLPDEIYQRHLDAVTSYRQEMTTLLANLDAIIASPNKGQLREKNEKALKHLASFQLKRKHQPFDPNYLPHHSLKPVKGNKPKTRKREFLAAGFYDTPAVKLAALGDFEFDKLAGANDPAYLAETVEVKLSPAIKAKAEELQYNPVKIYNFVRNNVNWLPTWGAIQDADLTLSSLQGNAMDISSLLISLLRASNVPCKYVHGTIEVPADKFVNWVGGFSDVRAAGIHAASGGIPIKTITMGGVIDSFVMEHIWVEAAIDFFPSRGAINRSADVWLSLDASYKQFDYVDGLDVDQIAPFDKEALVETFIASGNQNELEGWMTGFDAISLATAQENQANVLDQYLQDHFSELTMGDIFGGKIIQPLNPPTLPSSIPNKIIVIGARYAELNDNLRHKVTFDFNSPTDNMSGSGDSVTFSMAELNNQKIILRFRPATVADEATLKSFLPEGEITDISQIPHTIPSYLITVIPELRVNGNLVHSGSPITLGANQNFNFSIYTPNFGSKPYYSPVIAGSYLGIAVIGGSLSIEMMKDSKMTAQAHKTAWESSGDTTNLDPETLLGDMFHAGILSYFSQYYGMAGLRARSSGIAFAFMPSLGTYGAVPEVSYLFGFPQTITIGGIEMDLDRVASVSTAKDGTTDKELQFLFNSGTISSALEHAIPEQMFVREGENAEGVSAVKALYLANEQNIPIYHIHAENASEIIPQLQLSSETINAIRDAIAVGKEVITHQTSITVQGWSGAGYIIFDPVTGAGAFMIGGGMNGGHLAYALSFLATISLIIVLFFVAVALSPALVTQLALLGLLSLAEIIGTAIAFGIIALASMITLATTNLRDYTEKMLDGFSTAITAAMWALAIIAVLFWDTPLLTAAGLVIAVTWANLFCISFISKLARDLIKHSRSGRLKKYRRFVLVSLLM